MRGIDITDRLLPTGSVGRSGRLSDKHYLVIHEADCTEKGADALAHARYFHNLCRAGVTPLSYHYVVDSERIVRLIPDGECAFHAGDGQGLYSANLRGIGILLCVNGDGDTAKTRRRAAELVAHLLLRHDLDMDALRQHHDFGGKDCPHSLRLGGAWPRFVNSCKEAYDRLADLRRRCHESSDCPWYKVQICASRNHDEATALAVELREKGYMAYVVADLDYEKLFGACNK